jgi:hypothetical protein
MGRCGSDRAGCVGTDCRPSGASVQAPQPLYPLRLQSHTRSAACALLAFFYYGHLVSPPLYALVAYLCQSCSPPPPLRW